MDRPTYIYALCEPGTEVAAGELPPPSAVRYVGISVNPARRFREHCRRIHLSKYPVARWIARLRETGQKPDLHILKTCSQVDAVAHETRQIAWYKEHGANLLNLTDGGDGVFAPTAEMIARRAATLRETLSSPEVRSRYADAARGKKSEAHAAAIRAAWQRPEVQEKHSEARRNRMADPERAASSLAALERIRTDPEIQAKRIASLKATNERKKAEREGSS